MAPAAPVPGAPGHVAAPYGYDPYGRPYSDKSKTVAGVLQIALGSLGIGRFYIGDNKIGAWQCAVSILTLGIGGLWGIVDGAIMLGTEGKTDSEGRVLRK
ncbi:hypothetical protein GCM10009801_74730 [Streptomyces albiaxialis]|uniref:TM2 domain-containing protein n=1 Tax=Streptomyces albiaxialis TaxID=329523 RepID=A0ABN2WY42_9ACTN